MRLSQSASVPSPKGGNGNRLGQRTRKKHKRLDAICEDVFNQNRRVKLETDEGTSKGTSIGNDDELRRSSRVRRAPVILDSSPPPPKKRQKMDKLGEKNCWGSVDKLRAKRKLENDSATPSSANSKGEEPGAWRSRLRSRVKNASVKHLKRSGNWPRGKRKLFEDLEDDDVEINSVKNELEDKMSCLEAEKSSAVESARPGRVRALSDHDDELHETHLGDETSSDVDALRSEDDGDCTPLSSGSIDGNQEIPDGSTVCVTEEKSDIPADILVQEKQNINDSTKDSEQNDKLLSMPQLVEGVENQRHLVKVSAYYADVLEDEGCDVHKVCTTEIEMKHAEHETDAKPGHSNVNATGMRKPRVKEGRRCGLCGGGTDGKPPKRLANDSVGSDHEAYSSSSASEEIIYDAWDGFGDEPGWLGKLLGPINDRYGIAGIWVHQHCAVWSPEVYFAGLGCLKNVRAALCRGRALKCTRCGRPGATLGCRVDRCPRTYHLPCARASGCIFDHRKFLIACADHRYLFEPHGYQYFQRIKKLKAKKMKLEMRKLSNDASRKDIEAEEKWMEKCGEDEEFLRREAKRLQRDVLRVAPVYIGGRHSDGENLFDGWESVAGLQDVIRCMKEVVILPLLYPEFFQNMGITPPRGVLLHGYPGTGKTLVVRALIGSCSRGDKRIAYFARKGADCLGKYVGDAERQLRLLFQVAERSQPSIIFFDEIDGLAPVRTRQQDQTHSSVVSTLLALMDGLKSRGSVIVIGATNRPDAIDPALRRPGRFDREIYFPLPSLKDRATILSLHTRKWPKPVAGPLLEWVASKTIGFAGADLQALCAQAAVIALKRNCSWQQILACTGDNHMEKKRLQLPAFAVEERDWLEAISLAPPPCSRREAGMAANEVLGSPLPAHLFPCLLQPLVNLIIPLYLDDRLWLPHCLSYAGAVIKRLLVSLMEKRSMQNDRWWCHAPSMVQESDIAREIIKNLYIAGIVDGDACFTGCNLPNDDSSDDSRCHPCSVDVNPPGLFKTLSNAPQKKVGYRILIAGNPRSGQKHLASCLLHCFVGSIEIQKIDMATVSQEGHGDMEGGISNMLMKCASKNLCAVFMPRIDLWAIENLQKDSEDSPSNVLCKESSSALSQLGGEERDYVQNKPELLESAEPRAELLTASRTWKSFIEQLECICLPSSLIILATSELPSASLPHEIHQFFRSDTSTSEGSYVSNHATPRFAAEVDGQLDRDLLIHSSASDLSRNIIRQFLHLVHHRNHDHAHSNIVSQAHDELERDALSLRTDLELAEEPGARKQSPEVSSTEVPVPGPRNGKGKSTPALAISTFGYQILRYPHFAELCWVTSKLKEGPTADIRGPWKGWPFNSCIVRPCKSMQKETIACNASNSKGKDMFTYVRGLVAVGLSAYKGLYTSPIEVALEVRKVLEFLVMQIGARIQSGKDRHQFIRLLSQVACLEDMVNNWAHSLRSLEPDVRTKTMNPDLTGAQSPENLRSPASNLKQVGGLQCIQDDGLQETELAEGGLHGATAESSGAVTNADGDNVTELPTLNESSPKKVETAQEICFSREITKAEQGSPEEVILASNPLSSTELKGYPVDKLSFVVPTETNTTKCEALASNNHENFPMSGEQMQSTLQHGQFASLDALDQLTAATCNSDKLCDTEISGPGGITCQLNTGKEVETGISTELPKFTGDGCLRDFDLSSQNNDLSSQSKAVCSYRCCIGCIYTLHQLVKKTVLQEWELAGSCSTVEDVHDLVSSLSSSLCSTIRIFFLTGKNSSFLDEQQRSETYRKLIKSLELNACNCEHPDCKFTMLVECACHPGKDVSKDVNLLPYGQSGFDPTYMFKDGVLISADPDKEFSSHCKYDKFCLCSLIELIVVTRQPLD